MEVNDVEIGNRVKGLLTIFNMPRNYLASKMNTSYNTLTKKLNGKRGFTIRDFWVIKKEFQLSDKTCGDILFNPEFLIEKQTINGD